MNLLVEITFGLTLGQLEYEAMEECVGALLFNTIGMPFISIETSPEISFKGKPSKADFEKLRMGPVTVTVSNGSELENAEQAWEFVAKIRQLPIQLMQITQLRATLEQSLLAAASPQEAAQHTSSFYHGTFRPRQPITTTCFAEVWTEPWNEKIVITQDCTPEEDIKTHALVFGSALKEVMLNAVMTKTARRFIEGLRRKDEGMAARYSVKLHNLVRYNMPQIVHELVVELLKVREDVGEHGAKLYEIIAGYLPKYPVA